MDFLLKKYFHLNLTHEEMKDILLKKHGISVSVTTIKRKLSLLQLKRKNIKESPIADIVAAVINELYSCGYNIGYRALWAKLKKYHSLTVKRETVYEVLKIADPEGIKNRYGNKLHRRVYLSPGPNFIWHLDGYDKLKQFGFAIHGCIDGFSRYIIWLEVASTNNNPRVTANYFLNSVKNLGFLPTVIRSDRGTENVLIETLQKQLRSTHEDMLNGQSSFIKGKSTSNQRIESFWGQMRKHSMDFYIQLFKSLQESNEFDGSLVQVKCLQYCFGRLIQFDLECTKNLWNQHTIRKQAARNNISGKPYVMFHLPNRFNCNDFQKNVDLNEVEALLDCTTVPTLIDPLFQELIEHLLPDATRPCTPVEAIALNREILKLINDYR